MTTEAGAIVFRKIAAGLYGTGVHTVTYSGQDVEVVLDRIGKCWYVREAFISADGFDLTDYLGECFPTLRDAKASVVRGHGRASNMTTETTTGVDDMTTETTTETPVMDKETYRRNVIDHLRSRNHDGFADMLTILVDQFDRTSDRLSSELSTMKSRVEQEQRAIAEGTSGYPRYFAAAGATVEQLMAKYETAAHNIGHLAHVIRRDTDLTGFDVTYFLVGVETGSGDQ